MPNKREITEPQADPMRNDPCLNISWSSSLQLSIKEILWNSHERTTYQGNTNQIHCWLFWAGPSGKMRLGWHITDHNKKNIVSLEQQIQQSLHLFWKWNKILPQKVETKKRHCYQTSSINITQKCAEDKKWRQVHLRMTMLQGWWTSQSVKET